MKKKKCAVYDLTLYDGLHLGASVSSIVQRVSPDSTRCNGGARTLGQAVQGGTVLFFDDAVADLTEAGEATHQTQRTTRAMFLTDAVAAGLSESGLAVVGGRSSLKAQRESLMATVTFPVDPVACVSHRRGKGTSLPVAGAAKKVAPAFMKMVHRHPDMCTGRHEAVVHVPQVQDSFGACCVGAVPEEASLEDVARKIASSVLRQYPERQVLVDVQHKPHLNNDGFFIKSFVLGQLTVQLRPRLSVLHRAWEGSSNAQYEVEEFSKSFVAAGLCDCVELLSMERKTALLAQLCVHEGPQDARVVLVSRAIAASLTRDALVHFDSNTRASLTADKTSTRLYHNMAVLQRASLPPSMVSAITVPCEAALGLLHSEASFLTRFRYIHDDLAAQLRQMRQAHGLPEKTHSGLVEKKRDELQAALKKARDVHVALLPVLSPYEDRWKGQRHALVRSTVVNVADRKANVVTAEG